VAASSRYRRWRCACWPAATSCGTEQGPLAADAIITAMSEPTVDEVRRYIANGLACDHLEVDGDGRHFFATIVSADFEGRNRVARHQRVYQALGDRMREQIHALSMKTLTPAEWAAAQAGANHSS
jgi:acid stress-induced BolA-like protein IbaG/YrbA